LENKKEMDGPDLGARMDQRDPNHVCGGGDDINGMDNVMITYR
jgi:hypothetical protein